MKKSFVSILSSTWNTHAPSFKRKSSNGLAFEWLVEKRYITPGNLRGINTLTLVA